MIMNHRFNWRRLNVNFIIISVPGSEISSNIITTDFPDMKDINIIAVKNRIIVRLFRGRNCEELFSRNAQCIVQ